MKRIAIINGHPYAASFNAGLAKAYKEGALQSGADIQEINIADLEFNPNLESGYSKRTELEPDLLKAWEIIQWAEHLVWIHPVWWEACLQSPKVLSIAYSFREWLINTVKILFYGINS